MRAHKVISAFTHGGAVISPPAEWTPPSQARADKLIKAGCLKAPRDDVATATELEADGMSKPDAAAGAARQDAIAEGKSEGAAARAADKARADTSDDPTEGQQDAPPADEPADKPKGKGGKRGRK